jgi:hypothetical protein
LTRTSRIDVYGRNNGPNKLLDGSRLFDVTPDTRGRRIQMEHPLSHLVKENTLILHKKKPDTCCRPEHGRQVRNDLVGNHRGSKPWWGEAAGICRRFNRILVA